MSDCALTDRAREDWDRMAEEYQAFREAPGTFNDLIEIPAMLSLIGDVRGKSVLDAGCGHGYYSVLLAKEGAKVTGIDISERMIELARRNADKASIDCKFYVCDIQDLTMFEPDSFDLVTSSIVVGYLDDLEKAFSYVYRVLKPGGSFTFSENHPILMGWWERDKEGRRVHWNIDNYFGRSVRTNRWHTRDGDILETTSRLWIIQDYFDALVSAGFVVERLVEPEPNRGG